VLPGLQIGSEESPGQPQQQYDERLLEPQPEVERREPGQPKGPIGEVRLRWRYRLTGGRSHPEGQLRA
jgi:hypothetical protein